MLQRFTRWGTALIILALISAGTAYAGGEEEGAAETPVLRVAGFYEFNPNATSETLVMKWVGEATGTIIEPIHIARTDEGAWWNTRLASQDFPEITDVRGGFSEAPEVYGPQGMFVAMDVERDEGRMPAYQAALDAWDLANEQLFAPDGHTYRAYGIQTRAMDPAVPGYVLRADLLEAAGYTNDSGQFRTSDDVLQAIVDTKPHFDALFGDPTYGVYNVGARGIRNTGQLPRVLLRDEFSADTAMQLEEDNVWRFGPLNSRFKKGIEFLRTLYEIRTLHPDYLTMSEEDMFRQMQLEGKFHFGWGTWGPVTMVRPLEFEQSCARNSPSFDNFPPCDWETVEVVAPTVDGEEVWKRQRSRLGGSRILSAVSEHAAAAVKVVDFLYTDAGATLTLMGPEGYAWVYDDTPGNLWQRRWILCWSGQYPVDECRENDPDKSKTRGEMIGQSPLQFLYAPGDTWGMDWTSFYMDPADPTGLIALRGEVANIAARWIDEGTWHLPPAPQFPFTDDELDEKVQLEVQLHTYVDEQMTRFIDGQNDMSGDWEAFIDRIKQLSAGRLEEIYNTAMNGYLEAAGITLN